MNVFEDLIVELKQENLLENTVIDGKRQVSDDESHLHETEVPESESHQIDFSDEIPDAGVSNFDAVELEGNDAQLRDVVTSPAPDFESPVPAKPRNGQEFYRTRAIGEISNLQMVEHVLTGVEREYMKIVPDSFDDFKAKMALNTFLRVTENENSEEHQEAEFAMMAETEAWCTALAERDRNIQVSNLRQYCENSKPPLSSQALIALARFYRNLPYSSSVRAKFDFVITRLFSRATQNEMRSCIFTKEETFAHINTLYRDWSSIALYSAQQGESDEMLTALSFEDLAIEAENASTFDQLIDKEFFVRARTFKDGINEMFFSPTVLAAAIDANVRIGNAYVTLIDRERRKMDAESIQNKYGDQHDDSASDGAARTLGLVDILRSPLNQVTPVAEYIEIAEETEEPFETPEPIEEPKLPKVPWKLPAFARSIFSNAFAVNKWLLGVSILLISASLGLYFFGNFFVQERIKSPNVREVLLDDAVSAEYLTAAKVSGQSFYGLLRPSWDTLPKEKRREILIKIYEGGAQKGYTDVTLIGKTGKTAGFASATRVDVNMQ